MTRFIRVLFLCLSLVAAAAAFAADEATLTADVMNYNPETREIAASGNVHFKRPDGELLGDRGRGSADGNDFEMYGNVRGRFDKESLAIVCDAMKLQTEEGPNAMRTITASGDVKLTRGADVITAQSVTWEMEGENYSASGKVNGNFDTYAIDADAISRNGEQFSATAIRRYEDDLRNITLSAARANGLTQDGQIVEFIAEGNVVVNMPDSQGAMIRVTGDKGVFSLDRGTFVVSGNAHVNQSGSLLSAGSIVYHIDSGKIDALQRPTLVFEMPEN